MNIKIVIFLIFFSCLPAFSKQINFICEDQYSGLDIPVEIDMKTKSVNLLNTDNSLPYIEKLRFKGRLNSVHLFEESIIFAYVKVNNLENFSRVSESRDHILNNKIIASSIWQCKPDS